MSELTQEYLKTILKYNSNTGKFTWLVSLSKCIRKGQLAGSLHSSGYIHIAINKKAYSAHRLAWFYTANKWPNDQLDHINHIKDDNSWNNLRECTNAQNQANTPLLKNNTTGYKGLRKSGDKWTACISINNKNLYLGSFATKREAALAYNNKALECRGEFACLNEII